MFSKILTVKFWVLFITTSLKFAVGAPLALGFYNAGFLEGFLFCFAAGVFGVWFWLYVSKPLFKAIDYALMRYNSKRQKPKKKIFTKNRRRLAKFKMGYGLIGIAIITPVLLSIPVGTIIAARIYKHDRRLVLLYLAVSIASWSAVFSAAITVLGTTLDIGVSLF